jgi:glycosyltransferase involved in cell wall biosynthesis
MRVALLVTDLERGGTPLRLGRLACDLRDAGLDVHVGCLAPPGPVSADLEARGIPTFACHAHSARELCALVRLARHLQRIAPDLIHATLTHANLAARLAGDWLRTPVLTSTATIEVERPWHRIVERLTANMDRGHIVNSQALAAHVREAFQLSCDRIYVVPPALTATPRRLDRAQARTTLGLPADVFLVAWAGRFDPVKRLDIAIRCTEILADPPCHLVLAGDGPARQSIELSVARSPACSRIHLLGWQHDLAPVLSAADAFLFPSLTEGMPNAVLQAMALGLPVVGSNIPALRELAGDDVRLLLVDHCDAEKYATVLRNLFENHEMRRELGRRAAAWAQANLNPHETARAVIAVYERLLSPSD